jgi:hypothetical protein
MKSTNFNFTQFDFPPHERTSILAPPASTLLIAGCDQAASKIQQLYLKHGTTEVKAFININQSTTQSTLNNLPILSPLQAHEKFPNLVIVVASHGENDIAAMLRPLFKNIFFVRENATDISINHRLLEDQLSKDILYQHDQMIRNNIYVEGFSNEGGTQYEHPIVNAQPGEKILCVGPYYGRVLKTFADRCGNDFTAHCLEANPYVYSQLCLNLMDWGLHDKIVPVCAGAWSTSGMTAFRSDGHTGGGDIVATIPGEKIRKQELDMAIYTYTLDQYVSQTGFIPSLIESGRIGIATEVVKGAAEVITQYKPKLILLDFPYSDAPALIKSMVPEYKLYYTESNRINYGVFLAQVE